MTAPIAVERTKLWKGAARTPAEVDRDPCHNPHFSQNGGLLQMSFGWADIITCPTTRTSTLRITLYKRTFKVKDAPVSLSFIPYSTDQIHTFPSGGQVYEAKYSEVHVIAPDDVKLDVLHNRLVWGKGMGTVKATAKEVLDLATNGKSGFALV